MNLYDAIVADLVKEGRNSPYVADANELDVRYLSYGVRADGKKRVIKTYRAAIRTLSLDEKLSLAHRLIESRYGEQQSVGLFILESIADYFSPDKFAELDGLIRCLHGWSKVDSFTGSLLPMVLANHSEEMVALAQQWNASDDLWLRRASVVLFTRKVAKSGLYNDVALQLCDNLVFDSENLVLKGVGWSLKDMMRSDKTRIVAYVKKLRSQGVSSVVTLYAIKNLKGAERAAVLV